MKTISLGAVLAVLLIFSQWTIVFGSNSNYGLCYPFVSSSYIKALQTPTAFNDTLIIPIGCGNSTINGNLLENDKFHPDSAWLSTIYTPKNGAISYDAFGNFIFKPDLDFRGEVTITYRLSAIDDANIYSEGQLIIYVEDDSDCDNIINRLDIDDDNDGILDFHEGDLTVDTDGDGIPNCYDIDSDNDGITDFIEWQTENTAVTLLLCDENCDGWDDAFDSQFGGNYYEQIDTDLDGTPDFLDSDSDNDGISDFLEAFDVLNDQNPTMKFLNLDDDFDGLDNGCDTIVREASGFNPIGSCSPLPDHNNNGIRDWRDPLSISVEEENIPNAMTTNFELVTYPNPVVNNCNLILPINKDSGALPYSLSIYDINGKMVHLQLLYNSENKVSFGKFKKGIYIIRVKIGETILSSKIIKSS